MVVTFTLHQNRIRLGVSTAFTYIFEVCVNPNDPPLRGIDSEVTNGSWKFMGPFETPRRLKEYLAFVHVRGAHFVELYTL